ncbi:helix-turn-helix domain-containing protein [Lacticaseibacillus pabuli]|uniref:Helix-turn-helix domain-containing protein n=1 Tax=Lacticaseibacillus pabuli TaxID=3025672 RepID=A0ABY7WT09_9LACO|nr:helix-turn-helix domain-containing protein [Lacticaseibacillus sp. KACC 23028]WDF83292.1 helix-turn-helix domain-containing protein [Lacticaseibacillus sp. KACC 23028]
MKERQAYNCLPGCPVESTVQFIAGKWKSVILYHLLTNDALRFGELGARIPGCSDRMLAKQLSELEADQLIAKTVYSRKPAVTDYSVTPFGASLAPVIMAMHTWGQRYNQMSEQMAQYHKNPQP